MNKAFGCSRSSICLVKGIVFVCLVVFLIIGGPVSAQDLTPCEQVFTNTAQIARAFDCDVFSIPLNPPVFQAWLICPQFFWTDFSTLPTAFGVAHKVSLYQLQGVKVLDVQLVRAVLTGESWIHFGTNTVGVAAPAGYEASKQDSATRGALQSWNQYLEWGELDEKSDPPMLYMRLALADVQDQPTYEEALLKEHEEWVAAEAAKAASQGIELEGGGGGMMLVMEGSSCVVTDALQGVKFVAISQDSNQLTTVTWAPTCDDDAFVYGVFSAEEMSWTNLWVNRAALWGAAEHTSWVDETTTTNVTQRFYRVARVPVESGFNSSGVASGWAMEYGLNPFDPFLAWGDDDNDFWSNLGEFQQGTDPTNGNSRAAYSFLINGGAEVVTNGALQLSFPGLVADYVIISEAITMADSVTNVFMSSLLYTLANTNDGLHTVYVQLLKSPSTVSPVFGRTVEVDTHPPTLTITAPSNGVTIATRRINLMGFAADVTLTNPATTDAGRPLLVTVNEAFVNDRDSNSVWWSGWHDLTVGTNDFVAVAVDRAGFIVSNSVWVVYDPTLATNVPSFTVDVTNAVVVGSNATTIGVSGWIDDAHATVQIIVVDALDNTLTNAIIGTAVLGTNWWGGVPVGAGSNLVIISAQNTGSAAATNGFLVVQDSATWLELTSPVANSAINATNVTVSGVASTNFNGLITINGQTASTSNGLEGIVFTGTIPLPNSGANVIEVQASGTDGSTAVSRQIVYGYEIVSYRYVRREAGQDDDADCWFAQHYPNDYLYRWYENYTDHWEAPAPGITWSYEAYSYGLSGAVIGGGTSSGQYNWNWSQGLPWDESGRRGLQSNFQGVHLNAGNWQSFANCPYGSDCECENGPYCEGEDTSGCCIDATNRSSYRENRSGTVTFIKHWPVDEEQTVVLHFDGFYYSIANPITFCCGYDASQVRLWGQPGFWYDEAEGSIGFVVKIKTNTRYTLRDTDFSYPSFEGDFYYNQPNAQSTRHNHWGGQMLFFTGFGNEIIKAEFVRESPLGSGRHVVVDKVGLPVFRPDSGVGRGASPMPAGIIGLSITLNENLSTNTANVMNVTCETSDGSYSGQLVETEPSSGTFTNADSSFYLVVDPLVDTSDDVADAFNVRISSTSQALTNVLLTVRETATGSLEFMNILVDADVLCESPLNSNAVDTVQLQLNTNFDPAVFDGLLTETGSDTKIFTNTMGGIVMTVHEVGFDPNETDTLNATIENDFLTVTNVAVHLSETAVDSRNFSNLGFSPNVNISPKDPSVTGEGVFNVRLKGSPVDPDTISIRITTDAGAVDVSAHRTTGTEYLTGDLLLVPPGTTQTYDGITLVPVSGGEINVRRNDIPQVTANTLRHKAAFVGIAVKSLGPAYPALKNHGRDIEAVFTNKLGYAVLRDESMTKTEALAALPLHSVWYCEVDGVALGGGFNHFYALSDSRWAKITPEEVAATNGDNAYKLVFINGCNSADQDPGNLVDDFITAFHAQAYVGWQYGVEKFTAVPAAQKFFESLDGKGRTVEDAYQDVIDSGIKNAGWFVLRKGGELKIDLTP